LEHTCIQLAARGAELVTPVLNEAQKGREIRIFERKRPLEVVPRYPFMQGQRHHLVLPQHGRMEKEDEGGREGGGEGGTFTP
jgi:hypothetical protein